MSVCCNPQDSQEKIFKPEHNSTQRACVDQPNQPASHEFCMRCNTHHPMLTGCDVNKLKPFIGIDLSKDYIADCIKELKESVKQLFRMYNDLSELRHETNQNEGCTRAKVENDLMPQVQMLWEDRAKLKNTFNQALEFIGKRYTDLEIKDCEFSERIKKIEEWGKTPSPWALESDVNEFRKHFDLLSQSVTELQKPKDCHLAYNIKLLEQRIQVLEDRNAMPHVANQRYSLKPYKCPVCEGTQKRYFGSLDYLGQGEQPPDTKFDHEGRRYVACCSCDGKGIVWG